MALDHALAVGYSYMLGAVREGAERIDSGSTEFGLSGVSAAAREKGGGSGCSSSPFLRDSGAARVIEEEDGFQRRARSIIPTRASEAARRTRGCL